MIYWIIILLLLLTLLVSIEIFRRRMRKKEEFERAYMEGLKHMLDGEKDQAIQKLKLAVSQDTTNVDAYIRLGDLLRRDGKSDRALQLHLSLMVRPGISHEEKGSIARSLAKDYVHLKEPTRAISTLRNWIDKTPKDIRAKEVLLSLYEDQKLWKEAYSIQKDILSRKRPLDTSLLAIYRAFIGDVYLREGNFHQAREALKEALKIDKSCVPALISLGDLSFSSGNVEEAMDFWRKILKETPFFAPLVFSRLEKAYYDIGRFGELEDIYEDLVDRSPEDTRSLFALAELYRKKGKDGEAMRIFERILDLKPNSNGMQSALSGLLEISLQQKNLEKAREHARALSELMNSDKEKYTCSQCGSESREYLWRCPECSEWKTFIPPTLKTK
jgi:lipopolysaccharide biosynthesis regulator YciM